MLNRFRLLFVFAVVVAQVMGNVMAEEAYHVSSKDYIYSGNDTQPQQLTMTVYFSSDTQNKDSKVPAAMFFHGGAWVAGAANQFRRQAEILARHGMVAASVEYPLNGDPIGATRAAQTALCWFRQNSATFSVDPMRIAVSGGSAGGQLALASTLTDWSSNPACIREKGPLANALILFNPVLNMKGKWEHKFNANLQTVSPIDILEKQLPPTLILQGDADRVAPLSTAEAFASKAKTLGSPLVSLRVYKGREHGFFNHEEFEATTTDMVDFLSSLGWIH